MLRRDEQQLKSSVLFEVYYAMLGQGRNFMKKETRKGSRRQNKIMPNIKIWIHKNAYVKKEKSKNENAVV